MPRPVARWVLRKRREQLPCTATRRCPPLLGSPAPEHARRLSDAAAAHGADGFEEGLHTPSEAVFGERAAEHRFVDLLQAAQRERLGQQSGWVGVFEVLGAEDVDGVSDDRVVVERQPNGVGDRAEPSRRSHGRVATPGGAGDSLPRDGVDVRDGEHPAAVVSVGVVEDAELAR